MVHRAGIKRVAIPVPLEQWQFLRQIAAERRSSIAAETYKMARPEIERQRLLHEQRRRNGDETETPEGVTPDPD